MQTLQALRYLWTLRVRRSEWNIVCDLESGILPEELVIVSATRPSDEHWLQPVLGQ
jgi:hypothetical protein